SQAQPARTLSPPRQRTFLQQSPAFDQNAATDDSQLIDAGDHYSLAGGKRVTLLRSQSEIGIKYAEGMDPQEGARILQATRGIPELRLIGRAKRGGAGVTEIMRSADRAAGIDLKSVRASSAVAWAFAVLVDPQSGTRMVPTDQVLIGLAPGLQLSDV